MSDLLPDEEVARQLNISKKRLQNLRTLERGEAHDLIPAWVESGTSWRPRVRGTTQEAIDAWKERNTRGGMAA